MTNLEFRTARKSLKLGQLELAAILDLSRNAISNYETGKTRIPRVVEMALAHIEKPTACRHNDFSRYIGACPACNAEMATLAGPSPDEHGNEQRDECPTAPTTAEQENHHGNLERYRTT